MRELTALRNPFPGLRPFDTAEYNLFFGREGQSDEVLARLQRTRFLAVVGTSGSGKSSLVRAGVLPALYGGLMSGAGSSWRVAMFRPGHDPIGNLARALGEQGLAAKPIPKLPDDFDVHLNRSLHIKKPLQFKTRVDGDPPKSSKQEPTKVTSDAPQHLELTESATAEVSAPPELESQIQDMMIETTLRRSTLGLVAAVRHARLPHYENLLIVVDQFEELFRFKEARPENASEDDAAAFVRLLIEASLQVEIPIYVILTMRSDFLGDCAQFVGLPETINQGQYLIPRMSRDERRAAITGPVAVGGGEISLSLLSRLLNDVGDNPDQLPILQHALMRTWDNYAAHRSNGEPLGLEDYEAVGGMSKALSRHADEAFDDLPNERSRKLAEKIFKRLTEKGADNREIRRPTRLAEICAVARATKDEVVDVIEVFRGEGRSFLMPPPGNDLDEDTVIDISHESLIRNWSRLKKWVDEEAESARMLRRLAAATAFSGEGYLPDGLLDAALIWREENSPNTEWSERYCPEPDVTYEQISAFIDASNKARAKAAEERERQRNAELERERHDREQAQEFAVAQASAAQRLRRYLVAMVIFALVTLGAFGVAAYAFQQARANLRKATKSEQEAILLKDEAIKNEGTISELLKSEKTEKKKAVDAETDAKKQANLAKEQAKLAAARLVEAEAAKKKAVAAEERARTELIAKNIEIRNDILNRDALAQFRRGNLAEASEAFKKLADTYHGEPSRLAWAKSNLGETGRQLGKADDAIKTLQEALAIQKQPVGNQAQANNDLAYLDTIIWLADAYSDRGKHKEAQPFYLEALSKVRSAGNLERVARNYNSQGEPVAALKFYDQALNLRRKNRWSPELVATLKEVAEFQMELQNHKAAIALYEEALENQDLKPPDDPDTAETFNQLARVYEDMRLKKRAERLDDLAREIRRSRLAKGPEQVVVALENLAREYIEDGRPRRAHVLLERGQRIFAASNRTDNKGNVLKFLELGDLDRELIIKYPTGPLGTGEPLYYIPALFNYGEALKISRRIAFSFGEQRALEGLGFAALKAGRFSDAEEYYKGAIEILERRPEPDSFPERSMMEDLNGLAEAMVGQRKRAEAEAHLMRALRFFDDLGEAKVAELDKFGMNMNLLRHTTTLHLAELYSAGNQFNEADAQYRSLVEKLKPIEHSWLSDKYSSQRYLDIIERAGRFYSRSDPAAEESFYKLVWSKKELEKNYEDSFVARVHISSMDTMMRILSSYSALLKRTGRAAEAEAVKLRLERLWQRLTEEGPSESR